MAEEQKPLTLAEQLAAEFDKQVEPEEKPVVDEAPVVDEVEEPEVVAKDDDQTEATEPEAVKPPEHWSEEDQAAFMAMDDNGREWALRLETNAHKGIEEKSKELKKFRDAFEPYKHLVPPGVSEEQIITQLLNAQSVLQRNPVEGLKWLMRSYGVDEKQFLPTDGGNSEEEEFIDPEVRKLRDEIRQLKTNSEQELVRAQNLRQQQIFAEITQFRDAVDDKGQPSHPHFNSVQGVMSGLLQSGRASDMQDAYEQAVWSVPEYRDSVIEQQAKEKAAAELAEKTKAAKNAAKASTSVSGKSSGKKPAKPQTIADELSENYEKSIRGEL